MLEDDVVDFELALYRVADVGRTVSARERLGAQIHLQVGHYLGLGGPLSGDIGRRRKLLDKARRSAGVPLSVRVLTEKE